jgi:hypothetical protein
VSSVTVHSDLAAIPGPIDWLADLDDNPGPLVRNPPCSYLGRILPRILGDTEEFLPHLQFTSYGMRQVSLGVD